MIVNKKFTIAPFASPLQEELLCILAQGAIDGADLLIKLSLKTKATKQGIYKALRNLLENEVVIKEGRFYSLSRVWLSRFKDFIDEGENNLGINLPFYDSPLNGKKVITFKDAEALDIYWGHLYLTLGQKFKSSTFFFYNHHNWFMYERPHSETYLYKTSLNRQNKILITLGVNTLIAQKFKKDFAKNNLQIAIEEKFSIPKTDHICVVEDYFILTRYDKRAMALIDSLFKKAILFGEPETKELHKILANCKNPRIVIAKNIKKANEWKRRFAKNFVIKKSEL
jgi:hypothetical protein